MNILAKFHQERTIFALIRASEGLLQKKAMKFEVGVLYKLSQNVSNMMKFKLKKNGIGLIDDLP